MARRLSRLLLVAAACLLLFGAGFYLTMRVAFSGREVEVPALSGLPLEEARMALSRANLFLEVASERHDTRVPRGRVQSQEPPAGAVIKANRKVRVTLSLGPLVVAIPDLLGESLRTAQIALSSEGLQPGHVTWVHAAKFPMESVMAQNPLPTGSTQAAAADAPSAEHGDGRVNLLVSRGRREAVYVMPDLVGRTLPQASAFVRRAGLRLGAVKREPGSAAPRGSVLRQSPRAGGPVGRQEIVALVVAE